jgi:hypothetical protein
VEQIAWSFALGGFAGLVNYLQRFTLPELPPWEWSAAGIKVVTGGFVGVLTLWLIGKRIEDTGYVNVAIAFAGYGGPLTLDAGWQVRRGLRHLHGSPERRKAPRTIRQRANFWGSSAMKAVVIGYTLTILLACAVKAMT